MPGIRTDRRSRRTDQKLRSQLIRLMLQKPLKDISVTELAEACEINRATFYQYYNSVYDLHTQIEEDLIELFSQKIDRSFAGESNVFSVQRDEQGVERLPILTEIFLFIVENADTAKILLQNPDSSFLSRIYANGKQSFLNKLSKYQPKRSRLESTLYYDFIVNGCIGIIKSWVSEGMNDPVEQVCAIAERFVLVQAQYFLGGVR